MQENTVEERHCELQKIGWSVVDDIGRHLQQGMSEKTDGEALVEEALRVHGVEKNWHPSVVKFDATTLIPGVKVPCSGLYLA